MNIQIDLLNGFPVLTCYYEPNFFWELVKKDGWKVRGWASYKDEEDQICVEAYQFGDDLQAALIKFAEVTTYKERS